MSFRGIPGNVRSKGKDFAAILPKLPIKIPAFNSTNGVAIAKTLNRFYSNRGGDDKCVEGKGRDPSLQTQAVNFLKK